MHTGFEQASGKIEDSERFPEEKILKTTWLFINVQIRDKFLKEESLATLTRELIVKLKSFFDQKTKINLSH